MTADPNGAAMTNGDHVHATNGVTAYRTNGVGANGVNGDAPISIGKDGVNGHHHLNGQDSTFQQKPFDGLQEPMAIVGMAMRLPGGVRNTESFWDMLVNKRDGRCRVPADRYNVDAFYSAALKRGTVKMQHGYFLDDVDLRDLDPSFFSMTKSEVEKLDPQHRLLLEVVRECLENAGETKWRGKKIGCYVGVFGEDWQDIHAKDTQDFGMYRITGYGDFLLGNRVSYEYDFTGPSMTVKTGCSSSLICLHLACQAIAKGECSSAIVGGTNLIMSPTMTIAMTEQGVLSSSGMCKTFDADADGYARGDAINAVYVKKLSDAIRDGDPIRAVIRGSSTNSDGRTPGISHPSSESHEALIRHAYDAARIHDFSETAFVECHGTGTSIGDPLETQAVANVFGGHGVYIGSVKPNVGHSEGASGITSIIKSVLALEHKTIPPNINFKKPHPKIPFQKSNLQVPVEPTPWPKSRIERVSVNSFGIGGANAHVIIDSAASYGLKSNGVPDTTYEQRRKPSLLVFSANNPDSLRHNVDNYRDYVKAHPDKMNDLAYTLGARREHLPHRAYCVTNGTGDLQVSPVSRASAPLNPVFVFTGQGAQWAGMGKELMAEYPCFLGNIRDMDESLATCAHPPNWTIESELVKPEASSRLHMAEFSQPLCTALQVALINLLRTWNVHPTAVVGHSSGEIAGAYAADSISLSDAIRLAYYRGRVSKLQLRAGGMAAVGLGRDEVASYLVPGVIVACENSPSSVTLSGDVKPLERVLASLKLEKPDTLARRLKVDMAYHSHHMKDVGEQYQALISNIKAIKRPKIPFYSSVTSTCVSEANVLGPAYWRKNLESPVLFSTAVKQLLRERPEGSLFLEVGPHSALAGPLRQIFRASDANPPYISALLRDKNCTETLLAAAGQLHMYSVNIDLRAVSPGHEVLTDLPTYAWNHDTKYWSESRLSRDWRLREYPHHDILGSRIAEGTDLEPAWRTVLHLDDVPWIRDHMILQDIIFPGAGYIAMAGEAIRQITKVDDFTVRRVVIGAAMVLGEGKTTEVMTHLRPVPLTDTLDSSWFEFAISSHNGTSWTKHCFGQVRSGSEHQRTAPAIKDLPREVDSAKWYQRIKNIGLNYGPAFQGLRGITTSTTSQTAVASMINPISPNESEYQIHPSTLDVCIQIFSAAVAEGLPRKVGTLAVPTAIEELYVSRPESIMQMEAHASTTVRGAVTGSGIATSNGKVVLDLKGLKMSPIETDDGTDDTDPHAAVRLEWNPDIDFADASALIRPTKTVREPYLLVERLTLLCIIEAGHQLKASQTNLDYLMKFRAWLTYQTSRAQNGEYPLVKDPQRFVAMNSSNRLSLIESTMKEVQATEGALIGRIIKRVFDASSSIFNGKADALELLASDGSLTKLYDFADRWNLSPFLHLLRHSKPNMKVLEIGAGTGATTSIILNGLITPSGERMYSTYTFSDLSAGFFVSAKERFQGFQNVQYATLDISQDPVEQGFEEGSFDFIVAANVLHATPKIGETLRNVRKLLSPNGRLLLQELCPISNWANFIMGLLPGWWLGEDDGRPHEPYISPNRWDEELRGAGFSGADAIVYDEPAPFQTNAHIVARPTLKPITSHRVTLLTDSNSDSLKSKAESLFAKKGFIIDYCSLDQTPPPNQDVISLLDLHDPFFDNLSQENFSSILALMNRLENSGILWLTKSAQVNSRDPRYAQTIGMTRTIRNELAIDLATIEIDSLNDLAWESVFAVFSKFAQRTQDAEMNPEYEYSLSNGNICVGRFHWFSVAKELSVVPQGNTYKKLRIGKRGFLKTLAWAERRLQPVKGDEVQVNIRAVGMNFKDVLIAMGIVDGNKAESDGLGCESAGIVTHVGPDVKNLDVGDRVAVFSGNSYSTTLTTSSKLCVKMADGLTFEEAATMPCVYGTVIYSLLEIAKLEKDQTVLIHSACGGVGLSAIQVCQMVGAKIYATVGNEEKVQYLMDTFGLPRDRVFNSRNATFLQDIMRVTNGRGVDVVLNSLSGELLHASWQCVAEFGKMVEIGKRDFIGRGKLMMDVFEANRSFFGVDLAQICADKPEITQRLLEKCMEYCGQGFIKPIKPLKLFEAAHIEEAFRFMQKGQHIGKIVVSMPGDQKELPNSSDPQQLTLRPDVSYLLVGGLGGLGKSISTWMVENGARHLIYLGRSAGMSEEDKKFFKEIRSLGCTVETVIGSVSKLEDVKKAIHGGTKPVAGVIQMSMVLRDRPLKEMAHDDWEAAIQPKVQGTWNLHDVLKDLPHDFFVLFSSFSGIVGHWGQANYAAANTFLDAFAQYRHQQGLPASVLDIGAMDDVGYVSQNAEVQQHFRSTAVYALHEPELLDSLHLAILRSAPPPSSTVSSSTGFQNPNQIGIGLRSTLPMSSPGNRSIWKRDLRMALYRNLENVDTVDTSGANEGLKEFLSSVAADSNILHNASSAEFLAHEIGVTLFGFMLKPLSDLDVKAPLAALGVDSLVSIELKNWCRQKLGIEISVLEILNVENLAALGQLAVDGLKTRFGVTRSGEEFLQMKAP